MKYILKTAVATSETISGPFGPLDYVDDLQAVATSIYSFPREGTKESRNIF